MVKIRKLEYEFDNDIFIVDYSDISYIKSGDIILDSKDIGMTVEKLETEIQNININNRPNEIKSLIDCIYRKDSYEDTDTFKFLLGVWSDVRDFKLSKLDLE